MFRQLALVALVASVVLAACGGANKGEQIRADLAAIQAAINRRDAASLFDEFSDDGCREAFQREVFIANFQQASVQLSDVTFLDQNLQIDGDTAYVILTATFTLANGESKTLTFFETLVWSPEAKRWRDQDCFQGGLGGRGDLS